MPETGGLDIATLGLRVDGRPVLDAASALDQFTQAGAKAEAQAKSFGLSTEDVARLNKKTYQDIAQAEAQWQAEKAASEKRAAAQSVVTAKESARAQVDAIEREYKLSEAAIKEAVARGFISPKEAAKAGREAAKAYNRSLVSIIDQTSAAGGLNRNTKAGADAFLDLTGSLKNVDAAGRRANLGLGRLNDAMVTVARQGLGLNTVSGKLIDTVGTFAIGTAYMVPVLAGLAAIGYAWQKLTEESRKAREEAEKALDRLRELKREESLGLVGEDGAALARATARRAEIERQLARGAASQNVNASILAADAGRAGAGGLSDGAIKKLEAELAETEELIEVGLRRVRSIAEREQDRIDEDRRRRQEEANAAARRAADEAIRIEEQKARGLERLAAETARRRAASGGVVADLDQQLSDARRLAAANRIGADAVEEVNRELSREQALRQALANAVPADVAAITSRVNALYDLRDAEAETAKIRETAQREFAESLAGISRAQDIFYEEMQRGLQLAAEFDQQVVGTFQNIAGAVSEAGAAMSGFVGDMVGVQRELARAKSAIDSLLQAGLIDPNEAARQKRAATEAAASAARGGVFGFAGAAVSSIIDSRRERAEAVRQATEEFDQVLDEYVATLADRSRFEQLAADAESGARGALDALLNKLLADLATRGSFGAEAAEKIREAIAQGVDAGGLEDILKAFGSEGQQILDTYLEHLKRIDEQRQKEIEAATTSLRVRELIAQGLTEEAEALERNEAKQQAIKDALELGGKALADYTRSVWEQEDAARAAAKAEQDRADALARQRQTVQDRLSAEGREAALRGDDRGAFEASLLGGALSEQAALDDRLAKGEIELDLYKRLSSVIDREVVKALKDFDEAAQATADALAKAAAAALFREEQDLRSLEAELALLQGRDDAALAIQQQIRWQQALNDERGDEYLALLAQIQAQQLANREAAKAAETAKEAAKAQDELTRALDGGLKVLGGPAGFTAQVQSYRNQALRYGGGPGDLGVSSPQFTPTTNNSFEIVIQTQPGQDNVTIGQIVYEQIVAEVERNKRLGGFNRLSGF